MRVGDPEKFPKELGESRGRISGAQGRGAGSQGRIYEGRFEADIVGSKQGLARRGERVLQKPNQKGPH